MLPGTMTRPGAAEEREFGLSGFECMLHGKLLKGNTGAAEGWELGLSELPVKCMLHGKLLKGNTPGCAL